LRAPAPKVLNGTPEEWLRKEVDMKEKLSGTVLFVDDDEVERHALACVLQQAGLDVEEAATGGEALRMAARNPGLVVLDVNLPDIDGFEVCRRIKAHPATAAVPVLYLSGVFTNTGDVSRALAEGADGYLTKPVEPEELLARMKVLLRSHPAEEVARAAGAECRVGLTKGEAENLLDWLEANGYWQADLDYEDGNGFVVRWQACPAAESLGWDDSRSSAELPARQEAALNDPVPVNGDIFLGCAVALGIEACLAVLLVLPLCGVALPPWITFSVPAMVLAVPLVLRGLVGRRDRR
jgi:CheY-like chemotaxis protein